MTDIEQIEREAPKYKEAIELMAEEVAVIRVENQDILNRTFVLGQGDYPTGREIIASTANEIRKLRRALSDETARAVALTAENARLREELGAHDGDLDERMAALGMVPMSQLLSEPPTPYSVHVNMGSIERFTEWVEQKHAGFLKMRMRYETGVREKDDDLYEWVFAHCSVFGKIHDHLRAALEKGTDT